MGDEGRTEQQRKWLASVRASLQAKTGRTLGEWVEVARACPETAPRARQKWLKDNHGLGQNYAMMVLGELAEQAGAPLRDPDAFRATLWADPPARSVLEAIEAAVADLADVVAGQRKTYTTWSRAYAFASARPVKGGQVRLGLAVEPDADNRLEPAGREGWSERLKATLLLSRSEEVDTGVRALLRAAWSRS